MIPIAPAPHARYVSELIRRLETDARFESLLAAGSLLHGGMDAHSDIDLVLVTASDAYESVMAGRMAFAKQQGELLAAFTGEHVGEPRLLICLYGPPLLHVDLKFVRAADLDQLVERPTVLWSRNPAAIEQRLDAATINWPNRSADWFEARVWIWLHYGATKLQRGELFEAIGMLGFLREQVLGPMLHRRAKRPQRGVRRIEMLDESAAKALQLTITGATSLSVSRAMQETVNLYLSLRKDEPPAVVTPGMPALLMPMLSVD